MRPVGTPVRASGPRRWPLAVLLACGLAWICHRPLDPAIANDGMPVERASLNAGALAAAGRATLRHAPAARGNPAMVFDGNPRTALQLADGDTGFLEVEFAEPREVISTQVLFGPGATHRWSLLAGASPDSLSYLVRDADSSPDAWGRVETLRRPVRARVFRLEARRAGGGDVLQFAEWILMAEQRPESIHWEAPSTIVSRQGELPVRALVRFDGGLTRSDTLGLEVFTESPEILSVRRGAHPSDPSGFVLQVVRPGEAALRARIRGRGIAIEAAPLRLECVADGVPDWDVTHIERTPRRPFDENGSGRPRNGESETWVAHVKNGGTGDAPRGAFAWAVDDEIVSRGFIDALSRYATTKAELRLPYDGRRRQVRFVIDPADDIAESSEGNNDRSVLVDSLLLGVWVERSVVTWFQKVQPSMGDGAAGFEDWIQRHVRRWNGLLRDAVHPGTPEGITDRVSLDQIIVVEDGALPLDAGHPTSDPDASDRTVDLMWGFPASILADNHFRRRGEANDSNPLWYDGNWIRELSLARYLVDLRHLHVRADEVLLTDALGNPVAGSTGMPRVDPELVHRGSAKGLMAGEISAGYDAHSAAALQRIARLRARGGNRNPPPSQGEYLGDLPRACAVRVVDDSGNPLDGAEIRCWRRERGGDGSHRFAGEPFRVVATAEGGFADLSVAGRDPFFDGARDGALDPGRGVLILQVRHGGKTCWRFLEILPFNLAYWAGERGTHAETVRVEFP